MLFSNLFKKLKKDKDITQKVSSEGTIEESAHTEERVIKSVKTLAIAGPLLSIDSQENKNLAHGPIVVVPPVVPPPMPVVTPIVNAHPHVIKPLYDTPPAFRDRENLEEKAEYIEKESLVARRLREESVAKAEKEGKPLSAKEVMKLREKEEKERLDANKYYGSLRGRKKYPRTGGR